MSKGYGAVESKIANLFENNPDQKYTTWKLVEIVFEGKPPSKSRYCSVARAAKKVASDYGWLKGWKRTYCKGTGETYEEFVKTNPMAKGLGLATRL